VQGVVIKRGESTNFVGPRVVGTQLIEAERPSTGITPVAGLKIQRLQRAAPTSPDVGRATECAHAGIPQGEIPGRNHLTLEQALGHRLIRRSTGFQHADTSRTCLELQGKTDPCRTRADNADVVAWQLLREPFVRIEDHGVMPIGRHPWVPYIRPNPKTPRGSQSLIAPGIRVNAEDT
jgi:hypothetical protein